jgi:hypothetical protein
MGETFFDFFINEFRQNIMSSSKSIELGRTMCSKRGIKDVSMIERKLAAK